MIAQWISTFRPWGSPSHVTLGLCPYIPSFYLSRGGCRFSLLYRVVALTVCRASASPVLPLSSCSHVNKRYFRGFLPQILCRQLLQLGFPNGAHNIVGVIHSL